MRACESQIADAFRTAPVAFHGWLTKPPQLRHFVGASEPLPDRTGVLRLSDVGSLLGVGLNVRMHVE
jgi:hypothetical protein